MPSPVPNRVELSDQHTNGGVAISRLVEHRCGEDGEGLISSL